MTNLIPGSPGFVERLLAERIGLDVASVGEGLIHRGVENRMKQLGIRQLADYERILLGAVDEIQALIEEVVIPESWFFRDPRPFATFREFVRDGWIHRQTDRQISVLCLPCAAGEEPYSVVIALLELGIPRERIDVVAVDISVQSIRRAAAGLYSSNAFRGMDPQLQAEYFFPAQSRFLLKPAIRTAVRFEQGNLLDPELLGQRVGFDVVFCRNLLIYFDDQARTKAFANLDRLTTDGGILFLGHADRPDQDAATRFVPFADSASFAYQKQGKVSAPPTPRTGGPAFHSWSGSASQPPGRAKPDPRVPTIRPPAPLAVAPARASQLPLEAQPTARANHAAILQQAAVLADQGRYIEATRLVRDHMTEGSLDAPTHFLLGIIQQAAGNRAEAEAELTKAIYLDPDHDEALLALALLARRKGDVAAEATYRRRADRVLTRKGRS